MYFLRICVTPCTYLCLLYKPVLPVVLSNEGLWHSRAVTHTCACYTHLCLWTYVVCVVRLCRGQPFVFYTLIFHTQVCLLHTPIFLRHAYFGRCVVWPGFGFPLVAKTRWRSIGEQSEQWFPPSGDGLSDCLDGRGGRLGAERGTFIRTETSKEEGEKSQKMLRKQQFHVGKILAIISVKNDKPRIIR